MDGRRFQAAQFCRGSCIACASAAGIFRRLFEKLVEFYDEICGIEWEWASMDSAMVKAPKGGVVRQLTATPAPNTSSRVAMFSPFIRARYAHALTNRE